MIIKAVKKITLFMAFVTPLLLSQAISAQSTETFKEGVNYDIIEPALSVSTGDKVEVKELFWYGCPHCFRLEPLMLKWKENKPEYAEFIEVPAVFSKQWQFHAQAFYTIQALGIKEQAHQTIFDAIHVDKKRIRTLDQLVTVLKPLGKSEKEIEAAFNSFSVDSQMRNAALFSAKSGANAVPAIVIDGKYRTSVQKAGGHEKLLELMNFLAEKAKNERKS